VWSLAAVCVTPASLHRRRRHAAGNCGNRAGRRRRGHGHVPVCGTERAGARQPGLLALEAGTRRISAALATRPTEQPSGPHCIRLAISRLYAAVLTNPRSE